MTHENVDKRTLGVSSPADGATTRLFMLAANVRAGANLIPPATVVTSLLTEGLCTQRTDRKDNKCEGDEKQTVTNLDKHSLAFFSLILWLLLQPSVTFLHSDATLSPEWHFANSLLMVIHTERRISTLKSV